MKVIIPMAGMGKRMRPHTLTVPKPLIAVAGKPIVQRLVEDIAQTTDEKIEEIAFVVGRFGKEVENGLMAIAEKLGAKGKICYQDQPLGTAHAILCAGDTVSGHIIIAFADTLFKTDFKIDKEKDGVIWVNKVDDWKNFGVVQLHSEGYIENFVEKPTQFVSDLAIIGVYYIKDGDTLRKEMQYLLDNEIKDKGEYQLTNALESMRRKGSKFVPGKVDEWLDCGNKDSTVYTNQRVLELKQKSEKLIADSANVKNTQVIHPCYIGENVFIENSVVGPHVSIGENSTIKNSVISNSIIQSSTIINNKIITNSMIGSNVQLTGKADDMSVGDYTAEIN
ncbi:MAG: nucleotidyltransferase [Fimbriimonadaceae bacterium]|nr:nucleotidyltransferase [Chitinophagales bacterium]